MLKPIARWLRRWADRLDEFAEIDTTPEEFEKMWADGKPAVVAIAPRFSTAGTWTSSNLPASAVIVIGAGGGGRYSPPDDGPLPMPVRC